jgi:hypothetical protein
MNTTGPATANATRKRTSVTMAPETATVAPRCRAMKEGPGRAGAPLADGPA